MPITFPSRFLSELSLEIPDISTLFLLLYYSITTCCFSSSVTRVTGRVLVLKTTISSSEIRQKSESQNGCFKKTQHAKFSEKQTFLTPISTRTCAYHGAKTVRFSEKLACFVFLKHPFWDSPLCLITVRTRGLRNISFSENLSYFVFLKYPFWDSPDYQRTTFILGFSHYFTTILNTKEN